MSVLQRLGVFDVGESAVRVLNAVGGLNQATDSTPITTVLFHTDPDPRPWYGREADEVVQLEGAELDAEALVAAMQRHRIDRAWLGAWPGTDRTDLVADFELGGIAVVGPSASTISAAAARPASTVEFAEDALLRTVEIEVLADDHGTIWTLGARDVSIRRGSRVLIVEAPCSVDDPDLVDRLRAAAVEAAADLDYRGAGNFVFRHDGEQIALVAIDAVASPIRATTEERTGASVIGQRIRVERGEALGPAPVGDGVAIEARILAHDPEDACRVAPGRIALLSFPVGTGVRIDANRRVGDPVDEADPLIAVVTAWGADRTIAIARLRRALERTSIVVEGGATNRTLLLSVLRHPDHAAGWFDDGWLDRLLAEGITPPADPIALLAAAVEAYEADRTLAQQQFFADAARGRPERPGDVGSRIELSYRGVTYRLDVDRTGPHDYTVREGSVVADLTVDELDEYERRITCAGRRHRAVVAPTVAGFRVELDGVAHLVDRDDGIVVRADRPALVVDALVEPGRRVEAGDPIAVLESMKLESTVTAPFAGEIVAVHITPNAQIEIGTPLVRIRVHRHQPTDETADRLSLRGLAQPVDFTNRPCDRVYGPLGDYLLGYDLLPDALRRLLTAQRRLAEIAEPDDPALLACEDGLIDIYADLGALYRPQTETDPDELLVGENTQEYLISFLQWLDADRAGLPDGYRRRLVTALRRYGLRGDDGAVLTRTPELESALMWLFRSLARLNELAPVVLAILERRLAHRDALAALTGVEDRQRYDRLAAATHGRQQAIADLSRDVKFRFFDEPALEAAAAGLYEEMNAHLDVLARHPDTPDRAERIARLVWCPEPLRSQMLHHWRAAGSPAEVRNRRRTVLEVHLRRYYRIRHLGDIEFLDLAGTPAAASDYEVDGRQVHIVAVYAPFDDLVAISSRLAGHLDGLPDRQIVVDASTWRAGEQIPIEDTVAEVFGAAVRSGFGRPLHRLDVTVTSDEGDEPERFRTQSVTLRQRDDGSWYEELVYRNLHPMLAKRLELWRLANFDLTRRASPEDVYLFYGVARDNPKDRRLFALAEVRDLTPQHDPVTGEVTYPRIERTGLLAMAAMRSELARYPARQRPVANRLALDVTPPWDVPDEHVAVVAQRFGALAARAGLEKVVVKTRVPDSDAPDGVRIAVLHFEGVGSTVLIREDVAGDEPIRPLSKYRQKVLTAARFGSPYPYEIVRLLTEGDLPTRGLPADRFVELDLVVGTEPDGSDDELVPVDRPPGENTAHLVVGLMTNHTPVVPEGMTRVAILSDPTQGLGNLAEPECRRINAALAYAAEHRLPVEWFAVSSGALIAMDSGTENMDWIALTLRRLIEFTQAGGEVNIIVTGINVGGQPYWNAEATMLTHTRGILIMTPASAMVLTGKQALDFSGAVSAEDNFGIGGYDRVMGPNGQAQYWAPSFLDACKILLRHYELTYVVPGERFPRRWPTSDPADRDVRRSPHAELAGSPFTTVGDVFSDELNGDRKQPFDMRSVMRAVADRDREPLERWQILRDGDTSIVWDTTIGGIPVCLLGIESHTVGRKGFVPADGPPGWTSGTLFPHSSRKTARAVNAASGNRPLVVLANLSGFDGSPESMRRRQLEFGAEIGRAVTNFDGPIVFVVVSRYHGGAFVVFSKALNEEMEIAAVEGSFASVIGGAPAAATVFAREVRQRTSADPRVQQAEKAAAEATGPDAVRRRSELERITTLVRSEKLGEVADEFDSIHTIERARRVGSVDRIIAAADLRPYVIDALERGMARHV